MNSKENKRSKGRYIVALVFQVVLIMLFALVAVALAIHIIGVIGNGTILNADQNLADIMLVIANNGIAVLVLLLAIAVVITVVIEMIKFVCTRIVLLKNIMKQTQGKEFAGQDNGLTFILSITIVIILFYLSFRFSGFTVDDLINTVALGKYLALPLTAIILICAFCIFAKVINRVLLEMKTAEPGNIRGFFQKTKKNIIYKRISRIVWSVINIAFSVIEVTLSLVQFIPDFFTYMKDLIVDEDLPIEDFSDCNRAEQETSCTEVESVKTGSGQ